MYLFPSRSILLFIQHPSSIKLYIYYFDAILTRLKGADLLQVHGSLCEAKALQRGLIFQSLIPKTIEVLESERGNIL